MTIKHLGDLIIWVGAVAAALTAIGGLLYWVAVRPFVRWLREQIKQTRGAVEAVQETADAVQETAQAVHAEVTPNHGSSLKDQVTRTEAKVDALNQRLSDHIDHHPGGFR